MAQYNYKFDFLPVQSHSLSPHVNIFIGSAVGVSPFTTCGNVRWFGNISIQLRLCVSTSTTPIFLVKMEKDEKSSPSRSFAVN